MGSQKSAQELRDEARKLREEALEIEGRRIANDEATGRRAADGARSEASILRGQRQRDDVAQASQDDGGDDDVAQASQDDDGGGEQKASAWGAPGVKARE